MNSAGPWMGLSGERFRVTYRLAGDELQIREKAADICIEQTVEFPANLIQDKAIRGHIFGQIESIRKLGSKSHEVIISYAVELAANELTQFLNVIFGNISLKPGIRLVDLDLPGSFLRSFKGPRFGRQGWRERAKIFRRPMLCSAIKPMGLSSQALSELAYQFALGGIDFVKDDHGFSNQPFSPFKERVERSIEAIKRGNRESGNSCAYIPNITAPAGELVERALFAKKAGAGGLLISPGLAGLDAMRMLADDDRIDLPIMSHPAFMGSFIIGRDSGISHAVLFGQITRLAGADASIYPNWGGRFSFSRQVCMSIVKGTACPMGSIKSIFPAPGGGMSMERVPEMMDVYGKEVIFLMGGGLHSHGPDLVENCRFFRKLVEEY
jgi:ribulose-bisphosphate carboxylase large chain